MSSKMKMTPRQKAMWPILILGAFFEGFDDALINIALPYIKADFELSTQMSGYALTIIAFGTMVAFFISRMADSVGRRKVFLTSVYMYSICSLLTAFSPNVQVFIFFQFVARIFLIGCWSVGYVILCEEFDAENRGNAVGKFQLTAVFGALLIGILLPVFASAGLSWRALYVVGAAPIIPVFLMRNKLPETEAFLRLQEAKQEAKKAGKVQQKEDFFGPWRNPYTKYMVVMCLVWVFLYFGVKGTLNFFSLRVVDELSWTPNMVSLALVAQLSQELLSSPSMEKCWMPLVENEQLPSSLLLVACSAS